MPTTAPTRSKPPVKRAALPASAPAAGRPQHAVGDDLKGGTLPRGAEVERREAPGHEGGEGANSLAHGAGVGFGRRRGGAAVALRGSGGGTSRDPGTNGGGQGRPGRAVREDQAGGPRVRPAPRGGRLGCRGSARPACAQRGSGRHRKPPTVVAAVVGEVVRDRRAWILDGLRQTAERLPQHRRRVEEGLPVGVGVGEVAGEVQGRMSMSSETGRRERGGQHFRLAVAEHPRGATPWAAAAGGRWCP